MRGAARTEPAARHVLVLSGTGEGRRLADELARMPGLRVTASVAGRVHRPTSPTSGSATLRTGGFGGPESLAEWLRTHGVAALVDATHPFAEGISRNAALAARTTGVPLLAVRRPGWEAQARPDDRWLPVASLDEAAALLPRVGRRIFLTTGRQGLAAFAGLDELWFLLRSVETPEPPVPRHARILLDRGPYTVEGERALLREHRIDTVVTKDSGGSATAAKLTAAREAGLPVIMVRRPPPPEGVSTVPGVAEAVAWVSPLAAGGAPGGGRRGAAGTYP